MSCEELTHWKRLWCWEGLGAGGEGEYRGWDGWMASPTRWTWVWVNSGSWWWTGRPGVLQFMGSQRVGHDWATELSWTEWNTCTSHLTAGCYIPSFNPVRPSAWWPCPVHTYSKAKSIRCLGIPLSVQQDKKYNNYVLIGVYSHHICWHIPSIKLQINLSHRITYFLFLGLTSN